MHTVPEGFRHSTPVEVRFADLDMLGHVNNAKYLTYMETARIHYFRDLALWDGGPRRIGPIMARAAVDYRLPLNLDGSLVVVYTRCVRLGTKSYDVAQRIVRYREGIGETAADGLMVLVVYDYHSNQSVPIPDEWRARLLAYEPGLGDGGLLR